MARVEKTVFISYRRKDISWALAVYQYLTSQKYDVFFDYTSLSGGDFEQVIVSNIRARAHFVLILTPTALDRCNQPGDWLRREIETAIGEKRNIIPLFFDGFSFGSPAVAERLTGKLANINRYNGLDVPSGYFMEAMERLRSRYLNVPLDAVIHPVSTEVRKVVKEEKVAANKALRQQQDDIQELVKPVEEKPVKPKQAPIKKETESPSPFRRGFRGEVAWRPYAIGAGILFFVVFGVAGIRSLVNYADVKDAQTPTPTREIAFEITSTFTRVAPTATVVDGITPTLTNTSDGMYIEYQVQAGDTFGKIASKFGITVTAIINANGLDNENTIFIGQILRIPIDRMSPTPELGIGSTMTGVDGMTLLYVPAGEFIMGSDSGEADEKPVHTVNLEAFWIDQTEITNAMYAQCVQGGECNQPTKQVYFNDSNYRFHPVIYVTWNDAKTYCSWAGRRLPTEAEWEKAARGNDGRTYPWGEEGIDCQKANYEVGCIGNTRRVGSYELGMSPYYAFDMAGNVWEWVSSLYQSYPYDPTDGREDLSAGGSRVSRGGGWYYADAATGLSNRNWDYPTGSYNLIGFRCAMDASE